LLYYKLNIDPFKKKLVHSLCNSIMSNNIDIIEVNRRALTLVEQVLLVEPYANMSHEE
jgi:hypothetical protein